MISANDVTSSHYIKRTKIIIQIFIIIHVRTKKVRLFEDLHSVAYKQVAYKKSRCVNTAVESGYRKSSNKFYSTLFFLTPSNKRPLEIETF